MLCEQYKYVEFTDCSFNVDIWLVDHPIPENHFLTSLTTSSDTIFTLLFLILFYPTSTLLLLTNLFFPMFPSLCFIMLTTNNKEMTSIGPHLMLPTTINLRCQTVWWSATWSFLEAPLFHPPHQSDPMLELTLDCQPSALIATPQSSGLPKPVVQAEQHLISEGFNWSPDSRPFQQKNYQYIWLKHCHKMPVLLVETLVNTRWTLQLYWEFSSHIPWLIHQCTTSIWPISMAKTLKSRLQKYQYSWVIYQCTTTRPRITKLPVQLVIHQCMGGVWPV